MNSKVFYCSFMLAGKNTLRCCNAGPFKTPQEIFRHYEEAHREDVDRHLWAAKLDFIVSHSYQIEDR